MTRRVLLADDHTIVRDGLRALLQGMDGIEVVGETGDGDEAVQLATELAPDIVVMDVSMPGLSGIDATRAILGRRPETRVLALSMHSNKSFVLEMLRAGAAGYLLKNSAFKELSQALEVVGKGQSYLSPEISGVVLQGLSGHGLHAGDPSSTELSPREEEVLKLLAEGSSTRSIADRLHLSIKTVQTHRRNILEKLDLSSDAELIRYAMRKGLVSSES